MKVSFFLFFVSNDELSGPNAIKLNKLFSLLAFVKHCSRSYRFGQNYSSKDIFSTFVSFIGLISEGKEGECSYSVFLYFTIQERFHSQN
jgi:hypothetical protein